MNLDERYKWACETPSDIAELIPVLLSYAQKCDTITEFGLRGAVSTAAWMKAKPRRLVCYDIAVPECLPELRTIAKQEHIDFEFFKADTGNVKIQECDLLFVDTLHNAEHVQNEIWQNSSQVRRYMLFHDTEQNGWMGDNGKAGLKVVLFDFLVQRPEWELFSHYTQSNGLTVLKRHVTLSLNPK